MRFSTVLLTVFIISIAIIGIFASDDPVFRGPGRNAGPCIADTCPLGYNCLVGNCYANSTLDKACGSKTMSGSCITVKCSSGYVCKNGACCLQ
ncbi:hypothetical protein FO519_005281 [Halicephalobus sp. NKZ332]|nr:hypothetical protein FO519_005281 [Halicephalobus sp. NKZ332]